MEAKSCSKCGINPRYRRCLCVKCNIISNKKSNGRRAIKEYDAIINLKGEFWLDIPRYAGLYQASNLGRIKTVKRHIVKNGGIAAIVQEKVRKLCFNNGYYKVILFNRGHGNSEWVHRLIAETFIPNPDNKPQVNHKLGIKTDNRASELEWATYAEDRLHAETVLNHKWDKGIRHRGSTHIQSKKVKQIDVNTHQVVKIWDCVSDALKEKVAASISMCALGKLKTSGGYKWEYV